MNENTKNSIFFILLLIIIFGLFLFNKPKTLPQLEFKLINGENIVSAEIKNKIIVLNFWSTDCTTCIKEMPDLAAIHNKFSDDVTLIAVAMPYDLPSRVLKFQEINKLPFNIALDTDGKILKKFSEVKLTPTTIVVDQNKIIRNTVIGEINLNQMEKLIMKLL